MVVIQERVLGKEHQSYLASQHELARAYKANGRVKEAVRLLEHVIVVQERVLGKEHPSNLAPQQELIRAYRADGQAKKALQLLEHVVAVQVGVIREDHPSRLASEHDLTITKSIAVRFSDEAEKVTPPPLESSGLDISRTFTYEDFDLSSTAPTDVLMDTINVDSILSQFTHLIFQD